MFKSKDFFGNVELFRNQMNRMFNNWDEQWGLKTYPLVNVYDSKNSVIVTAELSGVKKEDVSINFTDGVLIISGEKRVVSEFEKMSVLRKERSCGKFEKSIKIGSKVNVEGIKASFVEGILTINLPKTEEAKPKTIEINA